MNQIDFRLHSILLQLQNLAKTAPNASIKTEIDDAITSLQEKQFRVAVLGDFKRGKSSLINALLGMNVLPVDIEPTTATVNRITYGLKPAATIHYKSGETEEVEIEELSNYVTKLTAESAEIAETVREAVIHYPLVLCENNVDIIDTPGLNDTESMTAVVEDVLQNIDAAIFAVKATMPYSETECEWVARMLTLPNLQHIVFAMTCTDLLRKREVPKMKDFLRNRISEKTLEMVRENYPGDPAVLEKAERILAPENLQIYPVSALSALEAFDTGDNDQLVESNLPTLKKELMTVLHSQQQQTEIYRVGRLLEKVKLWIQGESGFKEEILRRQALVHQLQQEDERQRSYFDARARQLQAMCSRLTEELPRLCQLWNPEGLTRQICACYNARLDAAADPRAAMEPAKREVRQRILYCHGVDMQKAVNRAVFLQVAEYFSWRDECLFPPVGLTEEIASVYPNKETLQAAVRDCLTVYRESQTPELTVKLPLLAWKANISEAVDKQVPDYVDDYFRQWKQGVMPYTENALYALLRAEEEDVRTACSQRIQTKVQVVQAEIAQHQQRFRGALLTHRELMTQYCQIEIE